MNIFFPFFQSLIEFFNSTVLLLCLQFVSFTVLAYIATKLIKLSIQKKKLTTSSVLLILFLIPICAVMVENIQWIIKYIFPKTTLARSIACLAWMISCFKFHSFLLFIEQLTTKNLRFKKYHVVFFLIEIILCALLIIEHGYLIMYDIKHPTLSYVLYATILFWFISIIPSMITILQKLSDPNIPITLKVQLKTLFTFFLFPHIVCILLEFAPLLFTGTPIQSIAFSNLGIILITAGFFFCFKKIMLFRFLNLSNHVQTKPNLQAATDTKEAIEQINIASNQQELSYITGQFFHDQFGIAKQRIHFYIRTNNQVQNETQKTIENFLTADIQACNPLDMLYKHKILVGHEIEFDEFYTDNPIVVSLAKFLRSIQCDIFLPIINNKKLIGYITVHNDHEKTLYNLDQQNKMMVFAQFLAPAIHMLQQQNTYTLLQETKQIKEELYAKHQELNQYKESIKQLLKDRIENHIGIVFYKSKHFAFKNQEAQTMLNVNPNIETSHPTSATLTNFAQQVEKFQTTQTMYLTMHDGSKLMITGMPHAQPTGGTLLIIRKPEATDLIKLHIDSLKNPSHRDFLLYLETTKAGHLINTLLPSNHETFLNIKIQLLQSALQKGALLLQMHPDDIASIVEIMHSLSGKDALRTIELQPGTENYCIKIFGINPLLSAHQDESALLEKLNNGTLIIKNIELLDRIAQQKLAHFIRYGIFTPMKSEQRKFSDTRIICTTSYNLKALFDEGIIIAELYVELEKNYLDIPSLITMDHTNLSLLIDSFMHQIMQRSNSSHARALNNKEKEMLIAKRIPSLFMLQQKVQTLMSMKASQSSHQPEEKLPPIKNLDTASPELQLAAQLGKHALKDVQLMKNLWQTLGNQTKIADLLGVNRSSVNRRCKEYNLL